MKKSVALSKVDSFSVHLDCHDVTAAAQERIVELDELQSRVVFMKTFIDHHLFAVMRPALGI